MIRTKGIKTNKNKIAFNKIFKKTKIVRPMWGSNPRPWD